MYELNQTYYNCIVVFDQDKKHVLFCKRVKDPYQGLYNFVGGKIEPGENGYDAAYRELEEVNPLKWLSLGENFADPDKFAGDQNIAHIINVAMKYPLENAAFDDKS